MIFLLWNVALAGTAAEVDVAMDALSAVLEEHETAPEVRAAAFGLIGLLEAGAAADRRASEITSEERLNRGRAALRRADYDSAIRLLEPLQGTADWSMASPYFQEAVDGWVAAERERAGRKYVQARRGPRSRRAAELVEVRGILAGLLETFPASAYASPVADNLRRVERELDALTSTDI